MPRARHLIERSVAPYRGDDLHLLHLDLIQTADCLSQMERRVELMLNSLGAMEELIVGPQAERSTRPIFGNGYCARPIEMDCHFGSICESCTFFVTAIGFRPILRRQRDDAVDKGQHNKGQLGRQKIFDGLLDQDAA